MERKGNQRLPAFQETKSAQTQRSKDSNSGTVIRYPRDGGVSVSAAMQYYRDVIRAMS